MKEKVIVGMSGGVDSSVTALLLKEQGYEVVGVTILTWQEEGEPAPLFVSDAEKVAKALGIPHVVMDFRDIFKEKVVDYFVKEYQNARTPNPCIVCNRYLKWEALLKGGASLGADKIATGHYAAVKKMENGRLAVCNSGAGDKDQTYVLYRLTQDQLSRTLFPLGTLTKPQIREIARQADLPVAEKKDSQEICFIPDKDYARFIEKYTGISSEPGNFVTKDGQILGRHNGLIHYTVGQRRGLGLPMGRRIFVSELKPETNEVVIAEGNEVFSRIVKAENVAFMGVDDLPRLRDEGTIHRIISAADKCTIDRMISAADKETNARMIAAVDKETNARMIAAVDKETAEGECSGSCAAGRFIGKIRYNHKGAACTAYRTGEDEITAVFDEPVRAAARGQALVLYQDGCIAAGGTIK